MSTIPLITKYLVHNTRDTVQNSVYRDSIFAKLHYTQHLVHYMDNMWQLVVKVVSEVL